jgi:RHS repeat-associated protein
VSSAGQVTGVSYRYQAYGVSTTYGTETDINASELGFTGALKLSEGILHMGARDYWPQMGRFLQPDTVDLRRYTYAAGDPLNRIDPTGHTADDPGGTAGSVSVTPQEGVVGVGGPLGGIAVLGYYGITHYKDIGNWIGGAASWVKNGAGNVANKIGNFFGGLFGDLFGGGPPPPPTAIPTPSTSPDLRERIERHDERDPPTPTSGVDDNEVDTYYTLLTAYRSATEGPVQGLINIKENSKGMARFDYGWNGQGGNTWTRNGVKMDADQFGNYIAGFQGAAYDQAYNTSSGFSILPVAKNIVESAGILYHLMGLTKAHNDPFDHTGMPMIQAGERDGAVFRDDPQGGLWP